MSTGKIVLYIGISVVGLALILCIFVRSRAVPKVLTIGIWALGLILLITGAFIDKFQEKYCCGTNYEQIFRTPLNYVRDPDDESPRAIESPFRDEAYTRNQYARFKARRNIASQRYQPFY